MSRLWKTTDLEAEDYCFDDEVVILRRKRSKLSLEEYVGERQEKEGRKAHFSQRKTWVRTHG